jgi:Uma2 family endonuclease
MSAPVEVKLMSTEELLALPDDGMDRELIRGELREQPMTTRNPRHSRTEAKLAGLLSVWLDQQAEPKGEVLSGEAGFRIRRNPDTKVGIDVAYISPELSAAIPEDAVYVDGVPILAVEILSPTNTQEKVMEKVQEYLDVGVALTWVVEPVFRTVTVYRPDAEPELFNVTQELSADPHLHGFRVPVARIFSK